MKIYRVSFLFCLTICPVAAYAVAGIDVPNAPTMAPNVTPIDEIFYSTPTDTKCATAAFADALAATVSQIDESAPETTVQSWIHATFAQPDVLKRVLACPEIANADDAETIKFIPIEYTFPGGRKIVVNYETQPKILKQRLRAATKRGLPDTNPNPRIGDTNDTSVWSNTEPAWYGIMVVQSGALRDFAGDGKNNTISLKYINDNIDKLYPQGFMCTSKSALANDKDELNQAVTKTVGLPDGEDSNDYYVAGNVELQWISYAEIALDVVITVATAGTGATVLGATKAVRATRAARGLQTTLKALRETKSVARYIQLGERQAKLARDIAKMTEAQTKLTREIKQMDRVRDAAKIAEHEREIQRMGQEIKINQKTLTDLEQEAKRLEKSDDNVKKYKESSDALKNLNKYRTNLHAMRHPQRGNVVARLAKPFRVFRAINSGGDKISKAAKLARTGTFPSRARDWLFHSTLANVGKLAKLEEAGGLLYGAITFVGDMYDWTESSTGDYTNGIEFKPLLLLSADDLQGQENIVNYGMWLMWVGDSVSAADDDAAYLQAMDFAEKLWQDLLEQQSDAGTHHCDIDIYVVRPIIRNPGEDDGELYYLIMNEEPWTTADTNE